MSALVSFGLAGGLDPGLTAGTLLLPRAFLLDGAPVPADPELTRRLGGATCDMLFCGSNVVASVADKALLFRDTGASGLDLESGAVVRVARERGLPVAALRAVCDPADRSLPPAALIALSGGGAIRLRRVLGSVLRHPGQVPALFALAGDAAAARRALLGRVRRLTPHPRSTPYPGPLPQGEREKKSPSPCGLEPRSGSRLGEGSEQGPG